MFSQSLPGLGGFPPAPPVFKKITKAFQKGNYTENMVSQIFPVAHVMRIKRAVKGHGEGARCPGNHGNFFQNNTHSSVTESSSRGFYMEKGLGYNPQEPCSE